MEEERGRLNKVSTRIGNCQAQVNTLRGSSKATTVFSTSKYPRVGLLPPSKTLFHDRAFADAPPLGNAPDDDVHFLPPDVKPGGRAQLSPDVLELYSAVTRGTTRAGFNAGEEGLGRLPEYVPSVSSVLLFNSSQRTMRLSPGK